MLSAGRVPVLAVADDVGLLRRRLHVYADALHPRAVGHDVVCVYARHGTRRIYGRLGANH